jgi:DNA-binding XRE family transcriptional regulator
VSRPPHAPAFRLGVAIRQRRGDQGQVAAGVEAGVAHTTLSRLERGTHRPSADTARKLATWLGWTIEEVLTAADEPVGG